MGKITRNELSQVLTAELDTTAAELSETGSKLDAAAIKQQEILDGVSGVKTDTAAIKADTTNILAQFPISGGTDFLKATHTIYPASGIALNNTQVNISGKGMLVAVSLETSTSTAFAVQLDDSICSLTLSSYSQKIFFAPFNSKLIVTWNGASGNALLKVHYLLF